MGSMAAAALGEVVYFPGVIVEVVTVYVVHEAVAVIVDPFLSIGLRRVGPHVGREIRMVVHHPVIYDGYYYRGIASCQPPCVDNVHVGPGH